MPKKSKAELLGIIDRIISMSNDDHLTNKEIEVALRDEGYDISRESIRRTVKSNRQIAKELKKTREETVALVDTIRDTPATDINEATTDFLISKVFEYAKKIDDMEFKDLPELSRFVKDMTNSKAKLASLRMKYQTVYRKVTADILSSLRKALEGKPELYEELAKVVSALEVPDEF